MRLGQLQSGEAQFLLDSAFETILKFKQNCQNPLAFW